MNFKKLILISSITLSTFSQASEQLTDSSQHSQQEQNRDEARGEVASASSKNMKDCAEIQDQINKAKAIPPATRIIVKIPAGTYLCKSPIIIEKDNVHLIGDKVHLKLADNANAPMMVIGSQHTKWMKHPKTGKLDFYTVESAGSTKIKVVKNVKVTGFKMDGNKDAQWFECWTPNAPARGKRGPDDKISNETCAGEGPSAIRNNGITIRGAEQIEVEDVELYNQASGGMVTEKYVKNLVVRRMVAHSNWFDGFAGYQTENSRIEDSELINNMGAGASLDIHFNNNTFLRTKLNNNAHQGIFARELTGNKWIDSEINGNGYQGVFLASTAFFDLDPSQIRQKARDLNFKVGRNLELPQEFYEQVIKDKSLPLDVVKKVADQNNISMVDAFKKHYSESVLAKRKVCANDNHFINTSVRGSGGQNKDLGTGIRVNDEECTGNCVDDATLAKFPKAGDADANVAGNFGYGTLKNLDPKDIPRCARR